MIGRLVFVLVVFCAACHQAAQATEVQQAQAVDGASLVSLYMKAIEKVSPSEKKSARIRFSQQIAQLPIEQRVNAQSSLLQNLRTVYPGPATANILGVLQTLWGTHDTQADADYLYGLYLQEKDQTLRNQLDLVLSFADGLYRDGIADYNSGDPKQFPYAEKKLEAMFSRYPKSEYAENAAFYLGQYFTKAYFVGMVPVQSQLTKSNLAFESYITHVEAHLYATQHFRASGYFFRGMNSWIGGDVLGAKKWLIRPKLSDDEVVYLWQLFYSPDQSTSIDRYCHAQALFNLTTGFLNNEGSPPFTKAAPLIAALKHCS